MLVGRPDDNSWDVVHKEAADALEGARSACAFHPKNTCHRRGNFPALAIGISHGGGQLKPKNCVNGASNGRVLESLVAHPAFRRIAGFASGTLPHSATRAASANRHAGAFATWAPRLYAYYTAHLQALLDHDHSTSENFPNSPWASSTFNFGPNTTCLKHRDTANLPFGWCSVTSLGTFDPERGGHLVLWDLGVVTEFPPGSTVLIPSAAVAHSNVPIQRGERRYSFTQYSAGGIFRWVDHGFQKEERFRASLSAEELACQLKIQGDQLAMGLGLFSTLKELRKQYKSPPMSNLQATE